MTENEFENYTNFIKETLEETMTLDDYELVIDSLDVPIPKKNGNVWTYKSFCHNLDLSQAKYNLAFYPNNRSYYCFSECCVSHNLLTLVEQRFKLVGEPRTRFNCMRYICSICDIPFNFNDDNKPIKKIEYNWKKTLGKYDKGLVREDDEDVIIDKSILSSFPKIYHQSWIDDNISVETMEKYGIRFYIYGDAIVIPCFNIDGKLIGIRCRCLNPNAEHKYYPLRLINNQSFQFPTNDSLYGLWYTKHAISRNRKCVIVESEKGVLQLETFYGSDNFSVALYGKAMSDKKKMLLLQLGITEIVICLDFDYDTVYDEEGNKTDDFLKYEKNVFRIGDYFKSFCRVTALISYGGHKRCASPTDYGKEWYEELYEKREELY